MADIDDARCDANSLQAEITIAFPALPYYGRVLTVSHDASVYDVETDNLDILLAGKNWKDLDPEYIESNHDEYVLMNEKAVPAFLAAWLSNAVAKMTLSNQVLSSLVFHLSVYGGEREPSAGLWSRGFSGLTQKQRDVIGLVLRCAANAAALDEDRARIEKALISVEANRGLG